MDLATVLEAILTETGRFAYKSLTRRFACTDVDSRTWSQAFPFGLGSKERFSVLAAREMKREQKNERGGRGSYKAA